MSFTLATPKMKYLSINLTKCVQGLHEENYKTLKKINEITGVYVHEYEDSTFQDVNSSQLYWFNTVLIKIPLSCFWETDSKVYMEE